LEGAGKLACRGSQSAERGVKVVARCGVKAVGRGWSKLLRGGVKVVWRGSKLFVGVKFVERV